MLRLFFVFGVILASVWTAKVPICKGISQTGVYSTFTSRQPLYRFSYNLNVTMDKNNVTCPNIVTVYNFTEQLLNNSIAFNRTSLLRFSFGDIFEHSVNCTFLNGQCVMSAPNAKISHFFTFTYNNKKDGNQERSMFLNDGTIYDNQFGHFYDPTKCRENYMNYYNYLVLITNICCTVYEYIDIPDLNENKCQKFETKAKIKDLSLNKTLEFDVKYDIIGEYLNASLKILHAPDMDFYYSLWMQDNFFLDGGNRGERYNKKTKIFDKPWPYNFQYEIRFSYYGHGNNYSNAIQTEYRQVIVGELIKRNEIFLKNNNMPYTKEDPCWRKKSGILYTNATYEASFCCIQFENDETTAFESSSQGSSQKMTITTLEKFDTTTTSPTFTTTKSTSVYPVTTYYPRKLQHKFITDKSWLNIIFIFLRNESSWFFNPFFE